MENIKQCLQCLMKQGIYEIVYNQYTYFRRPPQVKSSKADIYSKVHKIPLLKFNRERKLTSYAGIVIFQALFNQIRLKSRLRQCFSHLKNKCIYGQHTIVLLLIVHLILGFRRLRALDYYRHDPMKSKNEMNDK